MQILEFIGDTQCFSIKDHIRGKYLQMSLFTLLTLVPFGLHYVKKLASMVNLKKKKKLQMRTEGK